VKRTVAQVLACAVQARLDCIASGNTEWRMRHEATIQRVACDFLPSGSGFDNGTTVDLERSTGDKLVLLTAFHHMDQSGGYAGWTEHIVTVTPSFDGVTVRVSGRNRNGIKDYIAETFGYDLDVEIQWSEERGRYLGVTRGPE
jgi:hypothetical protein